MFGALAEGGQVHHAAHQDLLLAALRHARRQVRRRLDGHGRAAAQRRPEQPARSRRSHEQQAIGQESDFVISRVFDAPRELVWKCFTEPERMKQWWGPKGFKVIASKMDLRPGGTYHYGMKAPDGPPCGASSSFARSCRRSGMVFINSFSDEAGGTTRHPLHQSWPLEMLSIFTFEEQPGGKTKVTIRWSPHNATEEEHKTFDTSHDSMRRAGPARWTSSTRIWRRLEFARRARGQAMSLKLYFHPLASFCHKALIALYEGGIPFEPILVDLGDERSRSGVPGGVADGQDAGAARRGAQPHGRGVDHRRRIPGRLLPGRDAPRARRSRPRLADADVGPLLRPLRPGADAEDRRRSAAPAGTRRSVRRPSRRRPSSARPTTCSSRRCRPRPGRWATTSRWRIARRRPRSSMPTRSRPSTAAHKNLSAYLDRLMAPGILRARAQGGGALFRPLPHGREAPHRQTWRALANWRFAWPMSMDSFCRCR